MIFGTSEVIRPLNENLIESTKKIYRFGEVKVQIEKRAQSYVINNKEEAIAKIIPLLKHMEMRHSDYMYIEIFTDDKGIARMVECHMERVK